MDFQGRVIQFIGETSGTSKAGNPWKKKEWVVETFGQFPRKVKVQCFGDRADTINLEPGKDYTLFVDLESREYNGRWYTDVSVYRVDPYVNQQPMAPQSQPQFGGGGGYQQPAQNFNNAPYGNVSAPSFDGGAMDEGEGDLPF